MLSRAPAGVCLGTSPRRALPGPRSANSCSRCASGALKGRECRRAEGLCRALLLVQGQEHTFGSDKVAPRASSPASGSTAPFHTTAAFAPVPITRRASLPDSCPGLSGRAGSFAPGTDATEEEARGKGSKGCPSPTGNQRLEPSCGGSGRSRVGVRENSAAG